MADGGARGGRTPRDRVAAALRWALAAVVTLAFVTAGVVLALVGVFFVAVGTQPEGGLFPRPEGVAAAAVWTVLVAGLGLAVVALAGWFVLAVVPKPPGRAAPGDAGGSHAGAAPGDAEAPRRGVPGEDGAGSGFDHRRPLGSFAGAVWGLLRRPARFFSGTGPEGDYINPLVFAAVCGATSVAAFWTVSWLVSPASSDLVEDPLDVLLFLLQLALVGALILLPIPAGVLHPLLRLAVWRPGGPGFGATFRAVAYSFAFAALAFWAALAVVAVGERLPGSVPPWVLPGATAGVYLAYLVLGLRGTHGTSAARAAAAVVVGAALMVAVVRWLYAGLSGLP